MKNLYFIFYFGGTFSSSIFLDSFFVVAFFSYIVVDLVFRTKKYVTILKISKVAFSLLFFLQNIYICMYTSTIKCKFLIFCSTN